MECVAAWSCEVVLDSLSEFSFCVPIVALPLFRWLQNANVRLRWHPRPRRHCLWRNSELALISFSNNIRERKEKKSKNGKHEFILMGCGVGAGGAWFLGYSQFAFYFSLPFLSRRNKFAAFSQKFGAQCAFSCSLCILCVLCCALNRPRFPRRFHFYFIYSWYKSEHDATGMGKLNDEFMFEKRRKMNDQVKCETEKFDLLRVCVCKCTRLWGMYWNVTGVCLVRFRMSKKKISSLVSPPGCMCLCCSSSKFDSQRRRHNNNTNCYGKFAISSGPTKSWTHDVSIPKTTNKYTISCTSSFIKAFVIRSAKWYFHRFAWLGIVDISPLISEKTNGFRVKN